MSNLVRDALLAHLPPRHTKSQITGGTKYLFNCPACAHRGHRADSRKRASVFVNHDGSTGFNCFNCAFTPRQFPDRPLSKNIETLLGYMGMSQTELGKLRFDVWHLLKTIERGPPPPVTVVPRPLPSGAKSLGDWLAHPLPDANLADVLDDLDGMSAERIKSLFWTPEPGLSGDMNRRFIEVYGDPTDPIGWAAVPIGVMDKLPILSDDNIIQHMAERERDDDQ